MANLQLLIQQKRQVNQDTWDTEQREYVEGTKWHTVLSFFSWLEKLWFHYHKVIIINRIMIQYFSTSVFPVYQLVSSLVRNNYSLSPLIIILKYLSWLILVSCKHDYYHCTAYNKHKQLEESHVKLEEIGKQLTEKIKVASDDVQKLLKLRKRQVTSD